ncbi:molybdenum cofactor guanylyltransferase MobA [Denitrobaculum tricleocarpae]|uniref:Molybdenum cofactor guanylyltransferase n=1 Tax=Denitrobaculum tricleocarpae TaxID=2591009 RepID=A0A545T3Y9_9PROT|nr:molybdenum cofactor guanylyltransferase MobA [Denitrobaculum tricleocarpae]TQV71937.1 molybdenum cofactor guanylyltransferase MobA [Denitrobaculum tricleocarpae]
MTSPETLKQNVPAVAGVILAGGQSRRMGGGDKCLRPLGGRPILAQIIERAAPQVGPLVLNANGDPARFADYKLPVAADVIEGFAGPLAGILTGMDWVAAHAPKAEWMASFASDAPFFPRDMVPVMLAAAERAGANLVCAESNGRSHPVFGLWSMALREDLRQAVVEESLRKVDLWTARHKLVSVGFEPVETGAGALDPFFNTNRPDDLLEAETFAAAAL